ncbi:DUF3164 family protein [Laribacter hongkongensis]|uniref:DUF3164 family protein n=1 Tax=Laribacter hongkongensis TaxID=168471 RepID=UPI001EFDB0F2|nr:DUF3164 family protein [Laribacter hongkongensis]MCG8993241.1 DUF3164 family protein [Laribacter hongkongensis]MCG8997940.1 DUF3164 family protein [Laribacter hongkongensis]MCG9002349.1 DUF3164 family protein [Laribacter hongkongensis]MCG9005659.1 DUF3164 family protein [Laribacter hongkongensis]MCG9008796.1 DUF3164 family protein [Laribacter hongkongensis]
MNAIPQGYKQDAKGRLIPVETIKPIDMARDQLVGEIVQKAQRVSKTLGEFKTGVFADIGAFIELSAERYEAKLGGAKGNVSLVSFDGRYKVQRAIQDTLTFDEGLQAAKSLIDECVHEWTEGARSEIRALINDAFNVDKEGNISTGRILSLRRLDIQDEKWQRAMDALNDSVRVQCSKSYIRVYERVGDTDQYRAIPLDIAGV